MAKTTSLDGTEYNSFEDMLKARTYERLMQRAFAAGSQRTGGRTRLSDPTSRAGDAQVGWVRKMARSMLSPEQAHDVEYMLNEGKRFGPASTRDVKFAANHTYASFVERRQIAQNRRKIEKGVESELNGEVDASGLNPTQDAKPDKPAKKTSISESPSALPKLGAVGADPVGEPYSKTVDSFFPAEAGTGDPSLRFTMDHLSSAAVPGEKALGGGKGYTSATVSYNSLYGLLSQEEQETMPSKTKVSAKAFKPNSLLAKLAQQLYGSGSLEDLSKGHELFISLPAIKKDKDTEYVEVRYKMGPHVVATLRTLYDPVTMWRDGDRVMLFRTEAERKEWVARRQASNKASAIVNGQ